MRSIRISEDFILKRKYERIQDETSLLYGIKAVTGDVLFPCVFDKMHYCNIDEGYVHFEYQGKKAILSVSKLVSKLDERLDSCRRELLEFCAEFIVKVVQCPSFAFDERDIMNHIIWSSSCGLSSTIDNNFSLANILKEKKESVTVTIPGDFEFFKREPNHYCVNAIFEWNDIRAIAPLPINLFFRTGYHDDYQQLRSSRYPMELFFIEGEEANGFNVQKGLKALCNKPFSIEFLPLSTHPNWIVNINTKGRRLAWLLPIMKFVNIQDEVSAQQTINKYCKNHHPYPSFVCELSKLAYENYKQSQAN